MTNNTAYTRDKYMLTLDMRSKIEQVIEDLPERFRKETSIKINTLEDHGAEDVDSLIGALFSSDVEIAKTACFVLGRLHERRASKALLMLLQNHSLPEELRSQAATSLSEIYDKRYNRHLISLMKTSEDALTREFSAYILGWIGGKGSVRALMDTLSDGGLADSLRAQAAESLGHLTSAGKKAVPALIEALSDSSATVRFWSAFALGNLATPAAIEPLTMIENDNAFIEGYNTVGDEAKQSIETILIRSATH